MAARSKISFGVTPKFDHFVMDIRGLWLAVMMRTSRIGARSVPKEQHADQDKCRGNDIPDEVHPMDALTATKAGVFVLAIKTIPALHITNQPRQKL